ncbi:hypothetical protein [Paenibacillus taiwanensis]|uniref:hypothetical protein n=1 Tax=Paenibacillus taiwanensis TaxID=401638 RepID=UPI0004036B7D|nr:hypothetical protein [Paenibacillus taiwanensis]
MAKVKIVIEEELKYRKAAIVEIPDGIPGTIDEYLDKAEAIAYTAADIVSSLKNLGCKIESFNEGFESPRYEDAEIVDYEILGEVTES